MKKFMAIAGVASFLTVTILNGSTAWAKDVYPLTPDAVKVKDIGIPVRFRCQGAYPQHLQGFDGNKEYVFWSFTIDLVKTDWNGKLIARVPVKNHHGDLCVYENKVYVIANYGKFNNPEGLADNHVVIYDANDLSLLKSIPVPEIKHGGGAITRTRNGFIISGGLPAGTPGNLLYEYDNDFRFIRKFEVPPWTLSGVQTIQSCRGNWLLGCHSSKMLKFDSELKLLDEYKLDVTHGLLVHPVSGELYYAVSRLKKGVGWQATAYPLTEEKLAKLKVSAFR